MNASNTPILLVEPNVTEADRLLSHLQHSGVACHWARSLLEAQDFIRAKAPRALLIPDSLIDRIDALDSASLSYSQQEQAPVKIPIIAITDDVTQFELRGLSKMVSGVVARNPFDAERVHILVRSLMRTTEQHEPANVLTILIVEDDPFLSELMSVKFQEAHHIVLTKDSGEGVAELIRTQRPDIILLDLLLPGRNGVEVLADLKALDDTKTIPVIIVSNFSQESDVARARELGADGYILKASASPSDIMNETMRVLREHEKRTVDEQSRSVEAGDSHDQ